MAPNWFGRTVPLHATSTRQGVPRVPDARGAARGAAASGSSATRRRRSPTAARSASGARRPCAATARPSASASSRSRSSAPRRRCSPSRAGRSRSSASGAPSTALPRERLAGDRTPAARGRRGDQGAAAVSDRSSRSRARARSASCGSAPAGEAERALERGRAGARRRARPPELSGERRGRPHRRAAARSRPAPTSREFADRDPEAIARYYRETRRRLRALAALPQPTISAIHGYCLGGGARARAGDRLPDRRRDRGASGSPRSRSGSCRAPAARSASRGCSGRRARRS